MEEFWKHVCKGRWEAPDIIAAIGPVAGETERADFAQSPKDLASEVPFPCSIRQQIKAN